ncbi:hypothetical protein HG530_007711 [Fusarium avenaceum]|nr:hypothetical protein HG530_007711 [Fusarium avenaceum]
MSRVQSQTADRSAVPTQSDMLRAHAVTRLGQAVQSDRSAPGMNSLFDEYPHDDRVASLDQEVCRLPSRRNVRSCARQGGSSLTLSSSSGLFLSEMMRRLPNAFLVASPDNDALIIGTGYNTAILSTSSATRRNLGAKGLDVLRSRAASIRPTIPTTSAIHAMVNLTSLESPKVLCVNRLCFSFILRRAVWKITKTSLNSADQVSVSPQLGDFEACRRIENAHFPVAAATYNSAPIELDTSNAFIMRWDCLGANLLRPLPHFDINKKIFFWVSIKLKTQDGALMSHSLYQTVMHTHTPDALPRGSWDGGTGKDDGGKVLAASASDIGGTEDSGSPLGSLRFPLLSEDEERVRSKLAVLAPRPSRSISPMGTIAGLLEEKEDEGLPNMLPLAKVSEGAGVRSRSVISRSSSALTTARILFGWASCID